MVYSATIVKRFMIGSYKAKLYSYANTGVTTGGEKGTGLKFVTSVIENCETSEATTCNLVARSAGTVTLTTVAGEDGHFIAFGH